MTILNACNIPLNQQNGNRPNMGSVVKSYFVTLTFLKVIKTLVAGSVVETTTPINCQGTIQPFAWRDLFLKDIQERSWSWFWLHTDTTVILETDDVITYQGTNYRVKGLKPYDAYGYREYQIIQDFTGSGPTAVNS